MFFVCFKPCILYNSFFSFLKLILIAGSKNAKRNARLSIFVYLSEILHFRCKISGRGKLLCHSAISSNPILNSHNSRVLVYHPVGLAAWVRQFNRRSVGAYLDLVWFDAFRTWSLYVCVSSTCSIIFVLSVHIANIFNTYSAEAHL